MTCNKYIWQRKCLHWLDVPDWVLFKLAVTVHQCLNGRAPPYLSEHCIPVSSADTRRHLHSANCHLLAVPCFPLNTYGCRAFSVAGPDFIRDLTSTTDCLGVYLKRTCSRDTSASSALGVLHDNVLYKSTHTLTHALTHSLRELQCWCVRVCERPLRPSSKLGTFMKLTLSDDRPYAG